MQAKALAEFAPAVYGQSNGCGGCTLGWLIVAGVVVTLVGLAGLIYCVMTALKARKAGLDEEAMRAKLQGLVAWNMGALGLSALGLAMVIAGLLLG